MRLLPMKQSYRIIPTYTADVSGVCSALYELGGMTVMHDPSGCNSTYNTHDEIRWYDMDSLIFISGLTEMDAIMGNDERLIHDIEAAANELHPKFIALASSPIPYMNGTDFEAIAKIIEADTGICTFFIPTNGMHDYVYGAGLALAKIARHFTDAHISWDGQNKRTVNLLGVTPLNFGPIEGVKKMTALLESYGWQVISTWAMGDHLETLSQAGQAAINLVVSSVGLEAAKVLYERFGTPYVIGTPVDLHLFEHIQKTDSTDTLSQNFKNQHLSDRCNINIKAANHINTDDKDHINNTVQKSENHYMRLLSEAMETAVLERLKHNQHNQHHQYNQHHQPLQPVVLYLQNRTDALADITLIGEPVIMGSLAKAIELQYGQSVRVLCPLQIEDSLLCNNNLLCDKDTTLIGEEAMEAALLNAKVIVADPLYKPICPKKSQFYELPHIAFSGRIYLKDIQQLISEI